MYYQLALISVAIAAGYWGLYFIRAERSRTYALMLIGTAALAGLGLYGLKQEDAPPALGLAGAIGVGAGACLLVVGPTVRALARRFAAAERFGIAGKLLAIADVLVPGSGVREEQALLAAMREISGGNVDQTIDALTAAKQRAPAEARLAIDERIAMLYLAAFRWDDAIAHAEAHLFASVPPAPATGVASAAVALRRALGVAPPVWVELLGAYGYRGDLDQAARMLARLEDVCAGRDDAAIWVHRGRMMFLALAGRVAAVETLVAPRHARHMSRGARSYWVAVAHDRHGDGRVAQVAYEKARAQSRGRPRVLIDRALEGAPGAAEVALPPLASELVARVEAEAPPAVAFGAQPSRPWATRGLAVLLLVAAGGISLGFGDATDVGVLMRAGAMVRAFVAGGEWWRLVSCLFVHVGGLHVFVNAIGLWLVGRLCEELFGAPRTVAIFALGGVASSAASYLAGVVEVSAGASGAVFALLGAVFVELTLNRRRYRAAWPRAMWFSLGIVTIAQIAVGLTYTAIDQWAHGAGLVAGALAGAALSRHARWARAGQYVAIAVCAVFGALVVVAAIQVARTPLLASLGTPDHERVFDGHIVVRAPATWGERGGVLDGPGIEGDFSTGDAGFDPGSGSGLDAWTKTVTERAHKDFDQVDVATDRVVPLPPGWQGSELVVAAEDPDSAAGKQVWRVVVAGAPKSAGTALCAIYIPETMAREAASFFTQLIATIDVR